MTTVCFVLLANLRARRLYLFLGPGACETATLGSLSVIRQATPGSEPVTDPEVAAPPSITISSPFSAEPDHTIVPELGPLYGGGSGRWGGRTGVVVEFETDVSGGSGTRTVRLEPAVVDWLPMPA